MVSLDPRLYDQRPFLPDQERILVTHLFGEALLPKGRLSFIAIKTKAGYMISVAKFFI